MLDGAGELGAFGEYFLSSDILDIDAIEAEALIDDFRSLIYDLMY